MKNMVHVLISEDHEIEVYPSLHSIRFELLDRAEKKMSFLKNSEKYFVKVSCDSQEDRDKALRYHLSEVQAYRDLEYLHITPKFISSGILGIYRSLNSRKKEFLVTSYLILERWGQSVADTYFTEEQKGNLIGPGSTAEEFFQDPDLWEEFFPSNSVPEKIRTQIQQIVLKMAQEGWSHVDIHAGNFLVHNEVVKIIDLEHLSHFDLPRFGEENSKNI